MNKHGLSEKRGNRYNLNVESSETAGRHDVGEIQKITDAYIKDTETNGFAEPKLEAKQRSLHTEVVFKKKVKVIQTLYSDQYSKNCGPVLIQDNKEIIMMGAVNYLGLSHHPDIIASSIEAIKLNGGGGLGSMFSNGCTDMHKRLESEIINFMDREDCVLFNSGYMANLGVFYAFEKGTVVLCDKESHLSLYHACKASGLKYYRYRHNDIEHLSKLLANLKGVKNKWIVLVGTYGATGENVNLKETVELCKKHNVKIYLDDAHAIGLYGPNKRGLSELHNVYDDIDLLMSSFQMAFGNIGAFISGKKELINRIKYKALPYMFTYTIPANNTAALLEAFRILKSEEGPVLVHNLKENAWYLRNQLKSKGFKIISDDGHIISILTGKESNTIKFTQALLKNGLWVQKYMNPATPVNKSIVRLTPMATHTKEHLNKTVCIMEKCGIDNDII